MTSNKKILYCVLNWGLGHATRSEALIKKLMEENEVIIASDGMAYMYLVEVFGKKACIQMPSYNIKYGRNALQTRLKLLLQALSKSSLIQEEYTWVEETIRKKNINLVISDGRFGAFSREVESIYISHQIKIKSGFRFLDPLINWGHYQIMKNFDCICIPDYRETRKSLAGDLSRWPTSYKIKHEYLGTLSRFNMPAVNRKGKIILAILSGPEPQRSILENGIWELANKCREFNFIIIRGYNEPSIHRAENVRSLDIVAGDLLLDFIEDSCMIISRSGYSSMMDLDVLGVKNIVWIPTPGQGEQEYLAQYAHKNHWGKAITQNGNWVDKLKDIVEQNRHNIS